MVQIGSIDLTSLATTFQPVHFETSVSGLDPNTPYYVVLDNRSSTIDHDNTYRFAVVNGDDGTNGAAKLLGIVGGNWRTIDDLLGPGPGGARANFMRMQVTADLEGSVISLGDFNGDGGLGIDDLDILTRAIQEAAMDIQYDLDGSGIVDLADRQHWVTEVKRTWLGDSNLDGIFDSTDLIVALSFGQYEDEIADNSSWSKGDWNGDGEFDSGDLIEAFGAGGYEAGPRAAIAAVPEPSTILLAVFAILLPAPFALNKRRGQ